ncbi:hypothetical protein KEM60_00919 [Austwickia sp. TVS 96-490-7B]|uniref:PspC domain-containing protein n=1 Tax=Austwickia sp. TVS 96-490-7B TaxID=2830843 RepID=UPI001D1D6C0A|nr:PspC domain-containing protein [Austwickia sp. TVS 96-490-7B]MBW3084730.1 hypothetical protein [Austwickia sp. TVS 96-490-7B]
MINAATSPDPSCGESSSPRVRRMRRPARGRVLVGVAAGLADHVGIRTSWVRWTFVLVTMFLGVGLPAYLLCWVMTPSAAPLRDGQDDSADQMSLSDRALRAVPLWRWVLAGAVLVSVSGSVTTGLLGGRISWTTVVAISVLLAGAVLAWSFLDVEDRRHWLGVDEGRSGLIRVVIGALLTVIGVAILITRSSDLEYLGRVLMATLVVLAGLGIVMAPWAVRFRQRLRAEQIQSDPSYRTGRHRSPSARLGPANSGPDPTH